MLRIASDNNNTPKITSFPSISNDTDITKMFSFSNVSNGSYFPLFPHVKIRNTIYNLCQYLKKRNMFVSKVK